MPLIFDDPELQQQLEALLEPAKSDSNSMTRRPRCLEGTRKEYLDPIMNFLFIETSPSTLWLSGAAGSGKSTIAVTASDKCGSKGSPPAYIFFEREKSDPASVIRTLAYLLASHHPPFARHIFEALEENKTVKGALLKQQFEVLLLNPLRRVVNAITGPIVIVLDALDECGNAEQRRDLLQLLKIDFARLPPKVRILVTSRPEEDIMEDLQSKSHVRHVELQHETDRSKLDVGLYIKRGMMDALGKRAPNMQSLEEKIQALTDAADGLFIWASTAVKMVLDADDRVHKLESLVKDIQLVGVNGIDGLYAAALVACGISWQEPRSRERFSSILGLVLFAKEAMAVEVIEAILGLDADMAELTLGRLKSVLSYGYGKPVRLHHSSFADYLSSPKRSGSFPWHIDETKHKQNVAVHCFDVMGKTLRFNMCDIESSFLPNSEVPGLKERIASKIRPHLNYACRFWSAHMCELEMREDLDKIRDMLRRFAKGQLLYWLEVLSLTESFSRVAGRALREASSWITVRYVSSPRWRLHSRIAVDD